MNKEARILSKEEVLKIAHLARLDLTPEEVTLYQTRLGRVLEYVDELNSIATETTDFPEHVPSDAVAMREDVAIPANMTEALLRNAPQVMDNCFLLPPVVEHE